MYSNQDFFYILIHISSIFHGGSRGPLTKDLLKHDNYDFTIRWVVKDSSKKIETCKYESDRKDSSVPKYHPTTFFI